MTYTALYCRVSTERQQKGLEAQKLALSNYCRANSIKNFKVYEDFNISGAKSTRPELDRLLEDVRAHRVKQVIVYSFSRFARSTEHLLKTLTEFQSLDVSFISLSENIDTSTAMGKALFTIISAISQLERELVSERVKNGLRNAKAKGKTLGRKANRNSVLIRELRNQGMSYRKISKLAKCSIATVHRELKGVT